MTSPELSIQLAAQADGRVSGRVTFTAPDRAIDFISADPLSTLQQYASWIRNSVGDYLRPKASDEQRAAALRRVAQAGATLLDALLGTMTFRGEELPGLKDEVYAWIEGTAGILTIDSNDIHAPWNFLYLGASETPDIGRFIGSRHLVVQRISPNGRLRQPPNDLRILAMHGQEPEMGAEVDRIATEVAGKKIGFRRFAVRPGSPEHGFATSFDREWQDHDSNVVHIASHLRTSSSPTAPRSAPEATVDVHDSGRLQIGHILMAVGRKLPIMELGFFNICSLGDRSEGLDGGMAASLARRLCSSVSSDMVVANVTGRRFADAFYAAYLSGASAGLAYRQAKLSIQTSPSESIKSLCYRFTYIYRDMMLAVA